MNLYLTENGVTKCLTYAKPSVNPDDIFNDVSNHARNVGKIIRDFHVVYSDGPMRFYKPLYCTAEIS